MAIMNAQEHSNLSEGGGKLEIVVPQHVSCMAGSQGNFTIHDSHHTGKF